MRPIEIILSCVALVDLLRRFWIRSPRWSAAWSILSGLGVVCQLLFEGYRWQMTGMYALGGGLFLVGLPGIGQAWRGTSQSAGKARRTWLGWLWSVLAGVLVLILVAPAVLFPVPVLAQPEGPYRVGTLTRMLVDESRREIYSTDANEARRLMIQVWYPVDAIKGKQQAFWMPEAKQVSPAIAAFLGLPEFSLAHLKYVHVPSYEEAEIAQGEDVFPVVLFSHGWSGFRSQSSFLMHELASSGYVVVALEHPYAALLTVFPDGEVAANNPEALPDGLPEDEYQRAAQRLVEQWVGDLGYVLDQVSRMNLAGGEFEGRLDLQRVGVMGHSTGGGASVVFCHVDARCKAGAGLDAWFTPLSPETLQAGLRQPFLFLFSESWPSEKNNRLLAQLLTQPVESYVMTILGTGHYDFTDLPLLTPLAAKLGLKGPLNGDRVIQIVGAYVRAFFDETLKGQPALLLTSPAPQFPEVRYDDIHGK